MKPHGTIDRYKTHQVANGYHQRNRLDYNEIFIPKEVAQNFLALVAVRNWHLEQLDVHDAFLNGDLDEEMFMDFVNTPNFDSFFKSESSPCMLAAHVW